MSSKRDTALDLARVAGLALVVAGHASPPWPLEKAIYSFHMPLFFILSGMFLRSNGVLHTICSRARTLLLPYLTAAILTATPLFFVSHESTTPLQVIKQIVYGIITGRAPDGLHWNTPLWFLPALFWGSVWLTLCRRLLGTRLAIPSAAIVAVIGTLVLRDLHAKIPFGIDTGFVALFYLTVATLVRKLWMIHPHSARLCSLIFTLAVSVWIWLRVLDWNAYYVVAHMRFDSLPLFLLNGLFGSLALMWGVRTLLLLANRLVPLVWSRLPEWISPLAFHSLPVYLLHKPILLDLRTRFDSLVTSSIFLFLMTFLTSFLLTYLVTISLHRLSPRTTRFLLGRR